jgi:hypothetical protein
MALWPEAALWKTHMAAMPYVNEGLLRLVCQSCSGLETLSLHEWVAYTGYDVNWCESILRQLSALPRLRRVALPWTTSKTFPIVLEVEALLRSCPDLDQLNVPICSRFDIDALCVSNLAARLQQLSLYNLPNTAIGMLWRCPGLRRLHLHECDLHDLNLCDALPGELCVLAFEDCEGQLAYSSREALVSRFGRLQSLNLGAVERDGHLWSGGDDEEEDESGGRHGRGDEFARAMCSLTQLRVLSYDGAISRELNDRSLASLIRNCPWLHTLLISGSHVTKDGFELLLDATALPHLRVLNYENDDFVADSRRVLFDDRRGT